MKTSSSFKLSKEFKRMLNVMPNKHQRGQVKKLFIDADHTKDIMSRRRVREKSSAE